LRSERSIDGSRPIRILAKPGLVMRLCRSMPPPADRVLSLVFATPRNLFFSAFRVVIRLLTGGR